MSVHDFEKSLTYSDLQNKCVSDNGLPGMNREQYQNRCMTAVLYSSYQKVHSDTELILLRIEKQT